MQLDQAFGQREAEARPDVFLGLCIQNLGERLHDARKIIGADSDAGVFDADHEVVVLPTGLH